MDLEGSFCRLPLPEDDCAYNDDEAGEDCHDETLQLPGFFLQLLFLNADRDISRAGGKYFSTQRDYEFCESIFSPFE